MPDAIIESPIPNDPPLRAWLWSWVGSPVFRMTPLPLFGLRRLILRCFGTTLTPQSKVRPSVIIDRPWNLTIGTRTAIGDDAVIRAHMPVRIGDRCTLSQFAMLTTRMLDPLDPAHGPITGPITMEDDSWVATDVIVLPGTIIGEGTVIGARSLAQGLYEPWRIAVGAPAVATGPRRLRDARTASA
jgi:putative colanic acid biosynthesis acetyltransferase WcaF